MPAGLPRLGRGSLPYTHASPSPRWSSWRSRWLPAAAVYDGRGEILAELPIVHPDTATPEERQTHCDFTRADVWGDSREEDIFFGCRTAGIEADTRPLQRPTHDSNTLYPGM